MTAENEPSQRTDPLEVLDANLGRVRAKFKRLVLACLGLLALYAHRPPMPDGQCEANHDLMRIKRLLGTFGTPGASGTPSAPPITSEHEWICALVDERVVAVPDTLDSPALVKLLYPSSDTRVSEVAHALDNTVFIGIEEGSRGQLCAAIEAQLARVDGRFESAPGFCEQSLRCSAEGELTVHLSFDPSSLSTPLEAPWARPQTQLQLPLDAIEDLHTVRRSAIDLEPSFKELAIALDTLRGNEDGEALMDLPVAAARTRLARDWHAQIRAQEIQSLSELISIPLPSTWFALIVLLGLLVSFILTVRQSLELARTNAAPTVQKLLRENDYLCLPAGTGEFLVVVAVLVILPVITSIVCVQDISITHHLRQQSPIGMLENACKVGRFGLMADYWTHALSIGGIAGLLSVTAAAHLSMIHCCMRPPTPEHEKSKRDHEPSSPDHHSSDDASNQEQASQSSALVEALEADDASAAREPASTPKPGTERDAILADGSTTGTEGEDPADDPESSNEIEQPPKPDTPA
ncbi:hypothetical protein PPSIR1_40794 [Plesiocystis pacifica SIR-1]|uniref:Uncharacterized protein n=1 Tax=Plesiocystis pacifica SIR-1 TaxID=391625 RepID=A6GHD6_9BACT|nr:hypothetical protein [Plesiocystis pacifica]EDM74700.1 hypothetical protein PPSIR1_40794 [Plesiocystis pacifica SIR-1]